MLSLDEEVGRGSARIGVLPTTPVGESVCSKRGCQVDEGPSLSWTGMVSLTAPFWGVLGDSYKDVSVGGASYLEWDRSSEILTGPLPREGVSGTYSLGVEWSMSSLSQNISGGVNLPSDIPGKVFCLCFFSRGGGRRWSLIWPGRSLWFSLGWGCRSLPRDGVSLAVVVPAIRDGSGPWDYQPPMTNPFSVPGHGVLRGWGPADTAEQVWGADSGRDGALLPGGDCHGHRFRAPARLRAQVGVAWPRARVRG